MWTLHFDGALNAHGKGIGTVLLSPEGVTIPQAIQLAFPVTNNIAEYEALLAGLEAAHLHGVTQLRIIGDSQLILRQVLTKCRTLDPKLKPYQELTAAYAKLFSKLVFVHIPRSQNILADALASLASTISFPLSRRTETITIQRRSVPAIRDFSFLKIKDRILRKMERDQRKEVIVLDGFEEEDEDEKPWYFEIAQYCRDQTYPEEATPEEKQKIRRMAQKYTLLGNTLFRRSLTGVLLRCADDNEAWRIVEEAHSGVCGGHVNSQMLAKKILRQGFYWPTLEEDCSVYVRRCVKCQLHADKIHAPSSTLHPVSSPWPFAMWAFDVIGPLGDPTLANKHKSFILTATEYFTKWAEAEAYIEIKASTVCKFIMKNIIARFGIPHTIITDNGPQFISQEIQDLCNRYNIALHHSSPYYPQGNGQAEATNKTLIKIVKKTCESNKFADWPDRLVEALWAYRTSIRTPTGQTPFALTYGMEAVVPYELLIPSLRVLLDKELPVDSRQQSLLEQLELLDERRLAAAEHTRVYQNRLARFYQKKVIERKFKVGDMVVKRIHVRPGGPRSKLQPNWEGPYVIKEAYHGNAYRLVNVEGAELNHPWNGLYLKRYYP